MRSEVATFAAGCFWGVEEAFRNVPGVVDVEVGYTGGHTKNPTYEDVCTDTTGHAEAVRVDFNPREVSYETLVRRFYTLHDPTQLNRQGPDEGSQYRSAIFCHSKGQEEVARRITEELGNSLKYPDPIVTEIVPAGEWYRAEEYHQRYFEKNGGGVCHV